MHFPVQALPGALPLLLDPAAQAIAAQAFGRRAAGAWMPGPQLVIGGDLILSVAGEGVRIKEGTNARMGAATLVAGTVVVATSAVTANSRIMLTGQNSSGTAGQLTISARTAGTNFTITSTSATDTRSIAWIIFEPA